MAAKTGTGGGKPKLQTGITPDANTVAQQAGRDRLAEINVGLSRRLATLRSGVAVLAERIKEEGE